MHEMPLQSIPVVSVIVPARNCERDLRLCLENIGRSMFREFEVIVVDDASTDKTTEWIEPAQAQVLTLTEQSGPAVARNRGAELARGELLLFVDADVCIRPETIGQFVELFRSNPDVAAAFGSYDTRPFANNILSQYRNLMHHFVHQQASAEAGTFWTGCGAVRTAVFHEAGGFDPQYRRPCIEDIEFGVRLRSSGHRILLDKTIQVCHLKRWTLTKMIKADVFDRAYPWSRLIFRERCLPDDLNLRLSQRVSAVLALGLLTSLAVAIWHLEVLFLVPLLCLVVMFALDIWSDNKRIPNVIRFAGIIGLLAGVGGLAVHFQEFVLIPVFLLIGIVLLNWKFYIFLARNRHPFLAAYAVPLQILYLLYSTTAFVFAGAAHLTRTARLPQSVHRTIGPAADAEPLVRSSRVLEIGSQSTARKN